MLTSGASGRVNALLSVRAWRSLVRVMAAILLIIIGPFRGRKRAEKVVKVVPRRVTVDKEMAVRRALAMKRVEEDKNINGGTPQTVRDYSLFVAPTGVTLFTQSWSPLHVPIRGLVLLLHGLNEHSGRYSEFAKQLNGIGFKVYGMDWIGHGGSDGLHAYVPSLDNAITDTKAFLDNILSENPGLPCFCFGHSTGAAIALKAALDPKVEDKIHGFVLSSPAVSVKPSHPIFSIIAPIVSLLLPRYQCRTANKSGTVVSRDPEALLAKYSDPLVYTGAIRVRTGYEILRISSYLQENLMRMRTPFIVLHGSADTITDPEGSKKLHDEASSKDKMIKLYDGLLHDILFEPERKAVVRDIMEWLEKRVRD
ncbi:hypothetical protein RND81_06G085500 [Saponaria officinalis]|uniref:Serine aminopeptidase S33 domain-containing protein n=1 Tax=Saponaria officinalis TaxID=3572 RepID=A0AAW1K8A5_SAPOF